MTPTLESSEWNLEDLGEAVQSLARASGLVDGAMAPAPRFDCDPSNLAAVERWVGRLATSVAIDATPVQTTYADAESFAMHAAPAILVVRSGARRRVLALVESSSRRATLLGPDRGLRRVATSCLVAALAASLEAPALPDIDRFLETASVRPSRRARARKALLRERLASAPIADAWMLRASVGTRLATQVRTARLGTAIVGLLVAHVAENVATVLAWWTIGKGALEGRIDGGWLAAWALLLASQIPCRLVATWLQGKLAIDAGTLLKRRLLAGALALTPEEMRLDGAGRILGKVVESEALEALALDGGLLSLTALVQLAFATVILAFGVAPIVHPALLVAWTACILVGALGHLRDREPWTEARLSLTHDLVERMVGYRTQLAQQPRDRWHESDDASIDRYQTLSRRMDARVARLQSLLPRGWLLIATLWLAVQLISGSAPAAALAVTLGGMLLAFRAERTLAQSLTSLAGAATAWRRVSELVRAGGRQADAGEPRFAPRGHGRGDRALLEAHDLTFRYRPSGAPVLDGCSLRIGQRDRVLLEGASGGGKSTLGLVLAGVRSPQSGVLLLHGLDRPTLGSTEWRHCVVGVPQFHENHVLSGTFAYNLLLGRCWPPRQEDLEEGERVCRELGLGPLIARMPAGLQQMVGETGWQLSHGERSRLYMARALLQNAELVVLDETFAALDAETLRLSIDCALARAPALVVIAHV